MRVHPTAGAHPRHPANLVRATGVERCLDRQHDGMARPRVFDDDRLVRETRATAARV
jgi:hypothetical protein